MWSDAHESDGRVSYLIAQSHPSTGAAPTPPVTGNLIVSGIVSGDGTRPVSARVEVRSVFPSWRHDTSTDASGRYRAVIATPMPARVWVTAYQSMNQPCAVWFDHRASDSAERTADVSLTERPGLSGVPSSPAADRRTISGTVYTLSSAGKHPAADAWVAFDLVSDDFQAWTKTDADGGFALCGLPRDMPLQIYASTRLPEGWVQGCSLVDSSGDATIELILK